MDHIKIENFITTWCKNRNIVGGLSIHEYTYESTPETCKFIHINVFSKTLSTDDLTKKEVKILKSNIKVFRTEKKDVLKYFRGVIQDLDLVISNK